MDLRVMELDPRGDHSSRLLRARLPKNTDGELEFDHDKLSEDEVLMLLALCDIEKLRVRDPEVIAAEKLIVRATAALTGAAVEALD